MLKQGLVLLAIAGVGTASAQTVEFFFTDANDATNTRITNLEIGEIGDSFTLGIWFKTNGSWDHAGANVFIGFDRSNNAGLGATPLDNKLGLGGTATSSHSNINSLYGLFPANTGVLNGGYDPVGNPTAVRPYGIEYLLPLNAGVDTPTPADTPVHLMDVTLKNVALSLGSSYTISLYNAGQGIEGTTFLYNLNDATLRMGDESTLTVEAVPEPATIAALALGVGCLLKRRRK